MTTILCVRKGNEVVMAGDGQATLGEAIVFKSKSVKVRRIGNGKIIAGFAGAAADGITLIERLEGKLEKHANQLKRAAVELAKDWRMDKYLRQLQAYMIVADKDVSLVISGTGEVMEPDDGIIGIGSGGNTRWRQPKLSTTLTAYPRKILPAKRLTSPATLTFILITTLLSKR